MRLTRAQGRFLAALVCGIAAGYLAYGNAVRDPKPRDLGQVWFAARAVMHGQNPYPLVGPHLAYEWTFPLLYPLPAAFLLMLLTPWSQATAAGVFMAVSVGALAWTLTREQWGPLLGVVSTSVLFATEVAQWSPLLTATYAIPFLGLAFVAKPTVAAALFAARPSWWPIVSGAVLMLVAFVLHPHWLTDWLDAVHRNRVAWAPVEPYRAPVTLPGGVVALACLLRWRRPEARLVAVLACVPQTLLLYETVPLFLVPRTLRESGILVALSWIVFGLIVRADVQGPPATLRLSGPLVVALLYLPCTLMVLRRPNEGTVPAWPWVARWWRRAEA